MSAAALRAVLAALPKSVGEDGCEGWFQWGGGERRPDGSITMPWCEYGPRFHAFWAALKQAGALDDAGYDTWPARDDYLTGRKRIADAPRCDLRKWLFAVYRLGRFVEGGWADHLRLGRLEQAIARLVELDAKEG